MTTENATAPAAKQDPVQERLQLLARAAQAADKHLTPHDVVQDARDPTSPLHGEFEWNDGKAAAAYREQTARHLIRTYRVQVVTEVKTITSVAYVRDPRLPARQQGYVFIPDIVEDRPTSHEIIRQELSRARSGMVRAMEISAALDKGDVYDVASELQGMITRIDEITGNLAITATAG